MKKLFAAIKHAFAVDPPGPAEPTPDQREVVEWVCRQVARRNLTLPGLIALEMSRPLNYVGSQTMHFFKPVVETLLHEHGAAGYRHFAEFLERRGSIEYMARRIEEMEEQYQHLERRRPQPDHDPDPSPDPDPDPDPAPDAADPPRNPNPPA